MPQVVNVQFTVPTEDPDEAIATIKATLSQLDQADTDAPTADATTPVATPPWRVSSVRREAATTGVWRASCPPGPRPLGWTVPERAHLSAPQAHRWSGPAVRRGRAGVKVEPAGSTWTPGRAQR